MHHTLSVFSVCRYAGMEIFGVNKTGSDNIFLSKETQHQTSQDGWCSTLLLVAHLLVESLSKGKCASPFIDSHIKKTPAVSLSLILTFFLTCLVFALLCQRFCQSSKDSLETVAGEKLGKPGTKWAPTSHKWGYNLYKWCYKCVTGVTTLLILGCPR